jgi:hypothetical protein
VDGARTVRSPEGLRDLAGVLSREPRRAEGASERVAVRA